MNLKSNFHLVPQLRTRGVQFHALLKRFLSDSYFKIYIRLGMLGMGWLGTKKHNTTFLFFK